MQPDCSKGTSYLGFILLFFAGLISVFVFRLWQVEKTGPSSFTPQESSFNFKPPSEAFIGKLLSIEGEVKKESRNKEEFEEVSLGEEVLQGESLACGRKSQASVEFTDFISIDLDSNTEIGFISLLPTSFLVEQRSGRANYKLLQDKNSFSVRSLHALLTFEYGESEITVGEKEITVKILSGKAKLALVDLENVTHIWELEEGQKALINDTERRVEIE